VGEGGGWPEVVRVGVEEVKYFLIDENPFDIERLWMKLYDIVHGHGLTGAVRGGVISAIDTALGDIKGKALNVPVYELLGGKIRDRLRVYGHASDPESAKQLVDRGYTAFKGGFNGEGLKAVREAVGDEIEIGVHCHGQYTPSAAIRIGKACEPFEPAFFEEPTNPDDLEAMALVRDKVDIPLAAGERLYHKWSFKDLLQRNVVDIIQPEITRVGGILETKKVSIMAEAQGVKVAPHDGSAGPIAEMANIHVMATIPNFQFLEHKATGVPWRSEVAIGVIPDKDGYIQVPEAPGLGIDLDLDEIAGHPARATEAYTYRFRTPEEIQRTR
jgi:galactonate dehydratase